MMRNHRRLLSTVGATAAIAAMLMTVTATQASAIPKWSPANTTATGALGDLQIHQGNVFGYFRCNTSMTLKTALDGSNAKTMPAAGGGVTFSGCIAAGGIAGGLPVTMSVTGQWTVRPTSATTAIVDMPANSWKVTVGGGGFPVCNLTVGPGALSLPATWDGLNHRLRLNNTTTLPVSSDGYYCGSSGTRYFYTNSGWNFQTFSIIP